MTFVSVVISAHNPNPARFGRTLEGLAKQTLPSEQWETIVVDNASVPPLAYENLAALRPTNLRIVPESRLGLSSARRRGMEEARGEICVLVDDDNVLAPNYLETVCALLVKHPGIGIAGGKSIPEFEIEPEAWQSEFLPLLALRDLGPSALISRGLRPSSASRNEYPLFAPIGAGMALRREACRAWLSQADSGITDRRGGDLTSGGDNEIVLFAMKAGWEVAYFPDLVLTHLIPATRLSATYLARLNRAIQRSWMQVLSRHEANPWPPLRSTGATLRKARAWFVHRPWRSPAAKIRYEGVCGHFDGRIAK